MRLLVQIHHTARDPDQIIDVRLEELVAGIGFQDVQYSLTVVTLRIEAEILHHPLDLPAQHRDVPGTAVIGRGGPEAQEAVFSGDFSAGIEGLYAHIVEIFVAMNCGGGVCLGQNQQFRLASLGADVAAKHGDAGTLPPAFTVAENAEAGARIGDQAVLLRATLERVVTVAEKYEMASFHPTQQVACFSDVVGRNGLRRVFQEAYNRARLLTHRRPIGHGRANIGQGSFDVVLDLLDLCRIGLAVDLVELPGLGPVRCVIAVAVTICAGVGEAATAVTADFQHGVHDEVHGELGALEDDAQGIDQERHVVRYGQYECVG